MPQYSDTWMCEAYRLPDKIRMAVWRMDEQKDTIKIPLDCEIKNAKILYPSHCDGKITKQGSELTVTLNNPCTAAVVEISF